MRVFTRLRPISPHRRFLSKISAKEEDPLLYLQPAKWKTLPPKQILQLYRERVARLGHSYKPCQEELDALLTTSDLTETPRKDIERLYNGKDIASRGGMGDNRGGMSAHRYALRPYQFDELPSAALDLVAQHREQRFYNRLAAYELPLLTQYRQEYKRPDPASNPIKFKYTTYVGEEHPHERKVTMWVKTEDLGLNDKELHKFRLLARSRYDHVKDVFKMSSDRFSEASFSKCQVFERCIFKIT